MITVVSNDGVGERGVGGTYRLLPIGDHEYAIMQVED